MQNFWNLGDIVGGGENFLTKPQKAHPCVISCVLSHRLCKSVHGFLLQACARKKWDTTKSHRGVIFHVFAGNSSPNQIQPKLACE